MSPLSEGQARFAAALFDPDAAVPEGIVAAGGWAVERRFRVYRNNVLAGLGGALEVRFPVVMRLVGEEFFRAMARGFVRTSPPRTAMLLHWGDAFPAYIETFPPAAELPYLADVARLENAWWRAYHAADIEPIGAEALAAIDPERLAGVRVRMHPAFGLVSSGHPVVAIWATNTADEDVKPIAVWEGEEALVTRPIAEVEVRRLPPGGHIFLAALAGGFTFGEAIENALSHEETFDIAGNIGGLIEAGAIIGLDTEEDAP